MSISFHLSFEWEKNGNIRNTDELINMIDLNKKEVLFIEFGVLVKTISGKNIEEDLSDFRVQLPLLDKVHLLLPNIRYFFIFFWGSSKTNLHSIIKIF